MKIRHPAFNHTDENDAIYSEYSAMSPLGRLSSAFERDEGAGLYRMDRILARRGELSGDPEHGGNDDGDALMTRGRALYMYTHDPSVVGFGGKVSYCQPTGASPLLELLFSDENGTVGFSEVKDARVNYPSHWHGEYEARDGALHINIEKYITEQNCAVVLAEIENRSEQSARLTVSARSAFVSEPYAIYPNGTRQGELRRRFPSPENLTMIAARMTLTGASSPEKRPSDEFVPELSRVITVEPHAVADVEAVIAFTTVEIPASEREYLRLASDVSDHDAALRRQMRDYNEYWHTTVPFIDTPSASVNKAIDYRHWLERFNTLDADIPGYDYQYPVTIEGVLGYNNAIVLTQCMHIDDTKWHRTPRLAYGALLSVGACSGGSAFLDNPGLRRCWNNHYGQYIAAAGRDAFLVHGGSREFAEMLASYFEGDARGQLEHYGGHKSASTPENMLIAYRNNYMTGNDADTISMHTPGIGKYKMHAENAYVYGAARAAADMRRLAGQGDLANADDALANAIRSDILRYLWCDKCRMFETCAVEPEAGFKSHNPEKPNLTPLKECNNYNYFTMRAVPTDDASVEKYSPALRFLADPEEFPVFPYYTASQRDNKTLPGSNNFSNINFTVQARAYESALRVYDREHRYVTPEMLSNLVEWCAWNVFPDGGDVRFPNNSEFFNADRASDPCGRGDYYRSWIYHNILGNYTCFFIEDMAGMTPRADGVIELDPIDFGYGHFAVDNLRYHGRDVSVIYNADGAYDDTNIPRGYSLYVDGTRAFTLSSLSRAVYDPETGKLETDAEVTFSCACGKLPNAVGATLDETADAFLSRAGIVFKNADGEVFPDLALSHRARVTATYTPETSREAPWAEKHRSDGGGETSRAVNECAPSPDAVVDGFASCMPFWSNVGSPNERDALTLEFDEPVTFDTLAAFFYDDRQPGGVSYPRRYLIDYKKGDVWLPVTTRSQEPRYMAAGRNVSRFDAVTTTAVRVTFEDRQGHDTAVTEIRLYCEGTPRRAVMNHAPLVYSTSRGLGGLRAELSVDVIDDGLPFDKDLTCRWRVDRTPRGASVRIEDKTSPKTVMTVSEPGVYHVTLNVTDGEIRRNCSHSVTVAPPSDGLFDLAPSSSVSVDFCSDWERAAGVTDESFIPTSSNMGSGLGWGTWGSRDKTHTLTLRWHEPVALGSAAIFWYDDGGGIRLPASFSLDFETENGSFEPLELETEIKDALLPDVYNYVGFRPVRTRALRLVCDNERGCVGVYRIKAFSPKIEKMPEISAAVKPGERPSLPDTVTAVGEDGVPIALSVSWFADALDTSGDGTFEVRGTTSPLTAVLTAKVFVRGDMASAVVTGVDAVCVDVRAGQKSALPDTAVVRFNNGACDSVSYKIEWNDPAFAPRGAGVYELSGAGEVAVGGDVFGVDLKLNVL